MKDNYVHIKYPTKVAFNQSVIPWKENLTHTKIKTNFHMQTYQHIVADIYNI